MGRISVKYRIIGVHERDDMIRDIVAQCPHASVFYDSVKGKDCLTRLIKVLSEADTKDYSHICVMQDDIELCDNFEEIVPIMCERFPNAIFSPYNQRLNYEDRKKDSPYVQVVGCGIYSPCLIIPTWLIKPFVEWCGRNVPKGYPHDDEALGEFCYRNDIQVMATIPSLLQHLGIGKSTLGHNFSKQVSKVYEGRTAPSLENWYSKEYSKSHTIRGATIR